MFFINRSFITDPVLHKTFFDAVSKGSVKEIEHYTSFPARERKQREIGCFANCEIMCIHQPKYKVYMASSLL